MMFASTSWASRRSEASLRFASKTCGDLIPASATSTASTDNCVLVLLFIGLNLSANGAIYRSQGQVRSEAEHVAPGKQSNLTTSPERAKYGGIYFGPSGLGPHFGYLTRGDALRACPWLSYSAPLAL